MYAVIRTGGKQYRVAPRDVLRIEKIEAEPASTVTFEEVLLVVDGERLEVGRPLVEGARVRAVVLEQIKGPKIIVFKKKRRKNYRRKKGHRQQLTVVRIEDIALADAAQSEGGDHGA